MVRALTLVMVWLAMLGGIPAACGQDGRYQELARRITLAEQHEKQGQHLEAAANYRQARLLAAQVFGETHVNVAALMQSEGLVLRQLGNFVEAETLIEQTLKISEAVGEAALAAEAANNLAATRWELGRYLDALVMHEKAFDMFRQVYGEQSPALAVSRGNLAGVYKSLGQEAKAEPLYRQAIVVLERSSGETLELADAYMNLADLYSSRGELTRAEGLLLKSLEVKQRSLGPTHHEVARTQNNLASLYAMMGQYSKAEELHLSTLQILENRLGSEHLDVARSLVNLANVYHRQGLYDQSEPRYRRAVELRLKNLEPDHPDVALAKHLLAGAYVDMNQYGKASALYDESQAARESRLGTDHPSVAFSLMAKGHLAHLQGQYVDAERYLATALTIREAKLSEHHPDLAYTHNAWGNLEAAQRRYSESAEHFDQARRGFRRYIGQVLPALSEPDQLTFLREVDQENYQSALSLVAKAPDALDVIEFSAGWVLNGKGISQQTLAQRMILSRDTTDPLLSALTKSLLAVRKQLASLSLVQSESEDTANRQERIMELTRQERDQSARLSRLEGRPSIDQWVELATIRDSLPAESVLVEIARFREYDFEDLRKPREQLDEHYYAWVIPGDKNHKIVAVRLGDAKQVDEAVQAARQAISDAPILLRDVGEEEAEAEMKKVFERLSNQVLEPILAKIGTAKRVYLSPDSLLWLVPWNALPLNDGTYALEKYDFRFLVSGRDRVQGTTAIITGRPIMFADPNFDLQPAEVQAATAQIFKTSNPQRVSVGTAAAGTFKLGTAGRLPGTKVEAEAVRPQLETWAGDQAYLYSEQWALESVFKSLRQPKVLVLSTHGFFKSDNEVQDATASLPSNPLLQCGLLLAGCNHPVDAATTDAEDGILTGLEIVSVDLRGTELVVLSACETGLGEIRTGEGVAGLRQAFQLAGARAVISTLWQIPDRETAELMTSFFATLAENNDKAASLRAAQLSLIESRRERKGAAHPFFWAAFTITGE